MSDYQLLNSGNGRKLERFGPVVIDRPSLQAVWPSNGDFDSADALFTRDPGGKWTFVRELPDSWIVEVEGIRFKLAYTDFGHLGIFPEQKSAWNWIRNCAQKGARVLNLFAYSGGSTLAAAQGGALVTHLDASKKMVAWAKENAALNHLGNIRWIVDDALKFLKREVRRESKYDAIIMDPPSFGRGAKGEVFKIENDLRAILSCCRELLSDKPLFFLISCHSPGFTPIVLKHLVSDLFDGGVIECGEMVCEGTGALPLPSGCYARWSCAH